MCKIILRIIICVIIWSFFYFLTTKLLTPDPAIFSLKTGEFNCATNPECIKMAKEKAIIKWKNQIETLNKIERWSKFTNLSILPIRYVINQNNHSYNQISGSEEVRQLPAKIVCGSSLEKIEANSKIIIQGNLELKNVYLNMLELLSNFDGCNFELSQAVEDINQSLKRKPLQIGPNKYFTYSIEREFIFPIELDKSSHFFLGIQGLLFLTFFLLTSKPTLSFIIKGKLFFTE